MHFADAAASGDQEYSPWPHAAGVVSPNVLNYLVENFNIAPITTPEEDLEVLLKHLTNRNALRRRNISLAALY